MRKIYSLVLMATMLLVGTSAWAQANVAHVNNITNPTKSRDYQTLKQAFDDGVGYGDTATIKLLTNAEISSVILMNGGNENSDNGKRITLDLGDHNNIIGKKSDISMFVLTKGELHITGTGTIGFENTQADGSYDNTVKPWIQANQGVCVAVFGSVDPNTTEWSHLIVDENVTLNAAYAAVQLHASSGLNNPLYGFSGNKYWTAWSEPRTTSNINTDNVTQSFIWGKCNDAAITPADEEPTIKNVGNNYNKKRPGNATLGFGYGIIVDLYGKLNARLYGLQIKGTITATPNIPRENAGANFPRIYVHPNCSIQSADANTEEFPIESGGERKQPTGIYASGYAIWDIQGTVTGANGVYVKMGQIVVQGDANISSNATDAATAVHTSSGVSGTGNAITLQSDWEDGTMGITIKADENGGTPEISSSANGGAAIVETATIPNNPESQVQNITIEAGEFSGDVNGCVVISDNFDGDIEVTGGTYTGNIATLIGALPDDGESLIQDVVSQEGGTATVVIGPKQEGDVPVVIDDTYQDTINFDWSLVNANSVVNLKASYNTNNLTYYINDMKIPSSKTTSVRYLSLKGSVKDANTYTNKLIIQDNHTLIVDQIVMDAYASIVVEAGSKLIVTGQNGIFADDVNNLVLKAVEGNQSIFLLNPNVKTNRQPHATVEFVSKSYRNDSQDKVFQRFGIPTGAALESITSSDTYESQFGVLNNSWETLGFINPTGTHNLLDASQLNKPFGYYQILTNHSDDKPNTIFTMTGSLNGNTSPVLNVGNGWMGFSNGYMAKLGLEAFCEALWDANEAGSTIEPTIYTYQATSALNKTLTWEAVNIYALQYVEIEPMQAFLVVNRGANTTMQMDYDSYVWGYYFPSSGAPRRVNTNNNMTRAYITVTGADSYDKVVVLESDEFSAAYESGKDAEKYMNEAVNIYVKDEMNLNILATNDLNNSYLGFSCVEAGEYTLSFGNLNGKELTLVDLETNAQVLVSESNSYQFTVGENYSNDYRFKIISRQEMPTDIETVDNTEVKKGGIYTITGQYMGEMNAWNTLPAGLYIVNGEKKVK